MTSAADDVRQALLTDGFWTLEDEAIGKRLDDIVNSGFYIQTVAGMKLCEAAVFANKVSSSKQQTKFMY